MGYFNPQAMGQPVTIRDEGVLLTGNVSSIDFTGSGVSGSVLGSAVTETIPGSVGTSVISEAPNGTINDVNVTFTLAHTPTDTPRVYLNGARQATPGDYSISGTTITFVSAPLTGSVILVDYTY